jgi:hypothetical protein
MVTTTTKRTEPRTTVAESGPGRRSTKAEAEAARNRRRKEARNMARLDLADKTDVLTTGEFDILSGRKGIKRERESDLPPEQRRGLLSGAGERTRR